MLFRNVLISLGAAIALMIGFFAWYDWPAKPLEREEIEFFLKKISQQKQQPGGRHDLTALRDLLESDNGNAIYTVNLYKFRDRAEYLAGKGPDISGQEAFDKFAQFMIPQMIKRGSHPVFGSNWSHLLDSDWDRIVLVRYRSRRDLVDLFAMEEFADASKHKWAALEANERMVVEATHIPSANWPAGLLSVFIGLLLFFILERRRKRKIDVNRS